MPGDLLLTNRAWGELTSDRDSVNFATDRGDLQLVSGRATLAQSIVNRLLTRVGELSGLGHPDYGSRLYQLVGQPNTRRTQVLADLYIRESLAQEEQIQEIASITFSPPSLRADMRNVLEVRIAVRPVADEGPLLSLSIGVNLGA